MDEQEWVKLAQLGDLDAFNKLVLTYQDRVYTQAFYVLEDAPTAEDMTQEAFLTAYKNLASFRGGSFKGWLLRITTNLCLDELRRRKRHPSTSLEVHNSEGEELESPSWLVDPGQSPERATEDSEFWREIKQVLSRLPWEFRIPIILVDIHGLSYFEATEVLNVPLGTVKSRLARGRRMMSVIYQDRTRNWQTNKVQPAGTII
jgi:RNA polymerase sigma-70 factor (ECF subfamily)